MALENMGLRLHAGVVATTVAASLVLSAAPARADVVANPGTVTFTTNGGSISLGAYTLPFQQPATLTGTVDALGNVNVPQGGITFPSIDYTIPGFGTIHATFTPIIDATGTLNPATAAGEVTVGFMVNVYHYLFGNTCNIGSASNPVTMDMTTGPSGSMTGVGYDQSDGSLTLVSNTFSVPAASGCGFWDYTVNHTLGLPTVPGQSSLTIPMTSNPIFNPAVDQ